MQADLSEYSSAPYLGAKIDAGRIVSLAKLISSGTAIVLAISCCLCHATHFSVLPSLPLAVVYLVGMFVISRASLLCLASSYKTVSAY